MTQNIAKKHIRPKEGFFKRTFGPLLQAFREGDAWTRLSAIIMGLGNLRRGQIIKGLLMLAFEVGFFLFHIFFGWQYLKDFGTLGTVSQRRVWDEAVQIYRRVPGDNSMLILLFSVLTLATIIPFVLIWAANMKSALKVQKQAEAGVKPNTFIQDLKTLLDERFHITLLTMPMISLAAFTVLPIIFMVLIAFTNFDKTHQPPGSLFTWVGMTNVTDVFWGDALKSRTFFGILGWTLIWAVFATFTNYILGMILAMMINKKGIRLKKMWRTIFVITIAVPQFVSLLLVSKMFTDTGVVNVLLQQWGLTDGPIPFLTDPTLARILVIVVNLWVGIPYTMLMTTGILMNIPADLYESASIDGAGPVRQFFSITLPYMLFVTTPQMITTFVGNINNFNVIYLLTTGGPLTLDYYQAGKTDLLVTWLYKLTVNEQNYSLASTIGIFIFLIVSSLSLLVYNLTGSVKKEDQFQ
ncbi:MAG: sugar ABC transporter permease [Clostridiales bacterium]|nr:sugar ABC transporter permease [Clostridiales bacterium]MDD6682405.1 sugar ABC transporter permease [Clostridiales bacterium]